MQITLGGLAGLVAALAFAYLVIRLAGLLGRAGQILQETQISLRTTSENIQPTLQELTRSVTLSNAQLARVDTITTNVSELTTNASALTSLFAATLGSPLIKVASWSFGARVAFSALRKGAHR